MLRSPSVRASVRDSVRAAALASATVGLAACAPVQRSVGVIDSPPATFAALDTPGSLPQGSVGVTASGGGQVRGYRPLTRTSFRDGKLYGQGRVRVGVTDGLELNADGTGGRWRVTSRRCNDEPGFPDMSNHWWGGRAGLRWAPRSVRQYLALTAGAGGGSNRGGTFVAPDAGITLGYESGAVTPFIHLQAIGSLPINVRDFDAIDCGDPNRIAVDYRPRNAIMGRATFGVKFRLDDFAMGQRYGAINFYLAGTLQMQGWVSGGALFGMEFVFGRNKQRPQ